MQALVIVLAIGTMVAGPVVLLAQETGWRAAATHMIYGSPRLPPMTPADMASVAACEVVAGDVVPGP